MSADNTVLILYTKNEFRVGHFQAADNLWFTWNPIISIEEEALISARLFEYFYDIDPIPAGLINFGAKEKALKQAGELYDKIGFVEYGIQTLNVDKSFRDIALEASEQVKREILTVRNLASLSEENKAMFSEELETTFRNIHEWLAVHG